jgi:hypothetical protein
MGQETGLASLASEVDDAQHALLAAARTEPGKVWRADDLVRPFREQWRESVLMIALDQLITDKQLDVDSRWHIRVAQ